MAFGSFGITLHFTRVCTVGAPRGFGDLGRMAIYYQGAGEHWYFRGSREQAHNFGDIGSLAKKAKK